MATGPVQVGDPAPVFIQDCKTRWGRYSFDMAAGRYNILLFVPSLQDARTQALVDRLSHYRAQETERDYHCFVVTADPQDRIFDHKLASPPGVVFVWDSDRLVHDLYGIVPQSLFWVVTDPALRVWMSQEEAPGVLSRLMAGIPRQSLCQGGPVPVLMLPNVLEPEFCQALIEYYHTQSPQVSAILTQTHEGTSLNMTDLGFKRRRDCVLRDAHLVRQLQARIIRRVVPEIGKVFQCAVTRMDRMIVSCYDSADKGCFGPHRDNTLDTTKHRLFAVSINLNDAFDGGEIVFPEFSTRGFCPPAGGAVVFSCGLMHAVTAVSRGRRYACLPFVFRD